MVSQDGIGTCHLARHRRSQHRAVEADANDKSAVSGARVTSVSS
jgi:hypothetical protein